MRDIVNQIGELLITIGKLLVEVLINLSSSIINGFNFFITLFVNIPTFIFELFQELPTFYRIGLTGTFGCVLAIVVLKIWALLKI